MSGEALILSLAMAVAAGLVGCFAVMRRMALAADALSHVALPGIGVALALPVHGTFARHGIPPAQDHLAFLPGRLLAILANVLGTLAVVAVALRSFRQRPVGNALIVLGVGAAAAGSGLAGLGAGGAAAGIAAGVVLLYAGFVAGPGGWRRSLHLPNVAAGTLPDRNA